MIAAWTYDDLTVGQTADFKVIVTEDTVADFARVSGDYNPLHMSDEFARNTSFGQRVVHGMLVGSFFSRLVGEHLPGKHALFVSQELLFKNPVFIGDEVLVQGAITKKHDSLHLIEIETTATVGEKIVVAGKARVKVLA